MLQAEDILKKALNEGAYEVKSDESGVVGKVTNNPRLLKKLLSDLYVEMRAADELYPVDMDKAQLEEYVGNTMKQDIIVDQVRDGEERVLIMLALVARIMVETAVDYAELWQSTNRDMLVAFIMHMLTATMKDSGLPFPWHLGWFSGSYMRAKLGRMKNRQWNVIDRWIKNAEFDDRAQAALLAMYLVHYLRTARRPRQTFRAMRRCEVIRNWVGDERLECLEASFAEE